MIRSAIGEKMGVGESLEKIGGADLRLVHFCDLD